MPINPNSIIDQILSLESLDNLTTRFPTNRNSSLERFDRFA